VIGYRGPVENGTRHYDALIVGAGHNGLVAAAYLARAGKRVLVLERAQRIGGAAVTLEVWPGWKVSAA
jgi:phytoene dehydrogenase-like protein